MELKRETVVRVVRRPTRRRTHCGGIYTTVKVYHVNTRLVEEIITLEGAPLELEETARGVEHDWFHRRTRGSM